MPRSRPERTLVPLRNMPSHRLAWLAAWLAALPLETLARPEVELCGGEPMPAPEAPYTVRCAVDFGIVGNRTDVTQPLSEAVTALQQEKARLFLPAGAYGIREGLTLPAGTGLIGSPTGKTRLTNHIEPSLLSADTGRLFLDGSPASTHSTLIQDLHLENVAVVVSSQAHAVIRHNLFRGFRSRVTQLHLDGTGQRVVEDNVFWREPSADGGAGIELFVEPGATGLGRTTIRRNLIGAVDPDRLRPGQAESARQLARQAMGTQAPASLGHYASAIQLLGAGNTRVEGNVIASRAPTPAGRSHPLRSHPLAHFVMAESLALVANAFQGGPGRAVVLSAMSGVEVRDNTFVKAALRIKSFNGRPTKRVVVQDNWLRGQGIVVDVAVNGAGEDHTTPDDVRIADNLVTRAAKAGTAQACGYRLRQPLVGTKNFTVEPGRGLTVEKAAIESGPGPTRRTIKLGGTLTSVCTR